MSTTINPVGQTTSSSSTSAVGAAANAAADPAAAQDRFLKLLVAQLNNQDPMNPLDNAQMTSQIAQINTVTGIQQLNDTVNKFAGQLAVQQLVQGSSLVGHRVLVEGDTLAVDAQSGQATGGFDLAASAASVTVQVLDASGKQIGTVDLGALPAGRHGFAWDASSYQGSSAPHFKVVASNGAAAVSATPLATQQVSAVSVSNGALQLQLSDGSSVAQSAIKAVQ
ncbi:flagellar hook assembly protein FlgD [Extensimonas vulgaris]|uniref:Basal-body rod modification protein FlgD n=1 Tax=Extensimonas vulgaris TaxID=1031594 RepID=A0A369AP55_9BURK|nr:flagellar hook capping FlgD N-terminal domain-containing protein [Extensimonas vulgaris]RCX10961.1 flagellar basal-body rod modification protein FlgD [Extensimonas vulgaris]TWI41635.1 flagellar basal-body rod modification protein FlgD [Extensimonas vulgaris]TXD16108.1 flagellar hook assembly protein FlgD [Extensimonas vulgaris]